MNALAAIGHVALIKIAKLHLQLRSSLMTCLRLCNVDGPNVTWAALGIVVGDPLLLPLNIARTKLISLRNKLESKELLFELKQLAI
jgi:hypothetical protein